MAITDWPIDERPRERLLQNGPDGLSDAELLAIFLRMGVRGKSAVDVARDLLSLFGGDLNRLCEANLEELSSVPGVGSAKAAQLKAVFALSSRALAQRMKERDAFTSPSAVGDYLRLRFAQRPHEVFVIMLLDAQHRLIETHELFRGTLTQTAVYPREVARLVLFKNAAAVILAHNHPSGLAEPSAADIGLTRQLKETLALLDVRVLDHFIIVSNQPPLSMAERGLV